jgi:5-methylcytosine-specific restriction protein A
MLVQALLFCLEVRMALRPLRPCRKPGCPELTREGWCPKHKPAPAARKESEDWHWMYSLPIWKDDLRPAQLLREPFCQECAKRGLRVRATVVDHVIPHRGDWQLFIDPENHQSLCAHHHAVKTMQELNESRGKTSQK